MHLRTPRSLSPLLVILFAAGDALAGAWLQPVGASFVKASLLGQRAEERFDCRGAHVPADPAGAFQQIQGFVYGEYGLRDWVTLTGSWAYKDQRIDSDEDYGTRSFGDLRIGGRFPLLRGNRPVSVEAIASLPTYERSSLADAPADRAQYLPAGSGRIEGELHLLAGASLWPLPLYVNAVLGFRARGGEFEDQWMAALELGGSAERFFAKTELRWMASVEERCAGEDAAGTLALSERSVAIAPELAAKLHGSLWIAAGYAFPLSGRNSLDAGVWSVGLLLWDAGG